MTCQRENMLSVRQSFTHVDPFEDTERAIALPSFALTHPVSPTSIRSRILKDGVVARFQNLHRVSPTSIRSRILKELHRQIAVGGQHRFTHVDPFEDTESDDADDDQVVARVFHPRRSVRGY